jgi:hypothetical protein
MPPAGARLGNGMAVTSLVMGLLLCIPAVTGLGGVIFGVLGLKKTKDPRVGGKGLAIAGLVLGLVNLAFWGLFGGGVWALVAGTSLQRDMAKTFIKDMSEGNVTAAAAACHSAMPKEALESSSAAMKAWGALKDVTTVGINANAAAGQDSQVVVTGVSEFANAKRQFQVYFVKEGDKWKIVKFEFPDK